MCKIVRYRFTCQHGFQLRASQCGGTKHKHTPAGLTAACKSEPYLNTHYPVACGPCQYQAFETNWTQKLELARTSRDKLRAKCSPCSDEVTALVERLESEFSTAAWQTRTQFPHLHKACIARVNLGCFEKKPSPLRQELFPIDIRQPSKTVDFADPEYEYDWDYVASTDPLHPVDVTYAHQLEGVDPSWMLNHLSLEEFERPSGKIGFDLLSADTIWAGNLEDSESISQVWKEDTAGWAS